MLDQLQRAYEDMHAYFSLPGAKIAYETEPSEIGGCVYLTTDRHRCAVGCRIPVEWIEARGVNSVNNCGGITGLFDAFPEVEQFVGPPDSMLYRFHEEAQLFHDQSKDAAAFLYLLDALAREYGLEVVKTEAPVAELVTA